MALGHVIRLKGQTVALGVKAVKIGEVYYAQIEGSPIKVQVTSEPQPHTPQHAASEPFPTIHEADWYCNVLRLDNGKVLPVSIKDLTK